MKKFKILFAVFAMSMMSCEEVIQADLEAGNPKLVIDAQLSWQKGTAGNEQQIRLSTTASYYSAEVPSVSGAVITVNDSAGNVFQFLEEGTSGIYKCFDFVAAIGESYTLTVQTSGQTYNATETMQPAPDITNVLQENNGGFTGEDIEVRAFFTDNGSTDDYYLFRYRATNTAIPFFEVVEDRFFQGNEIFALYSSEDLEADDTVEISIYGISERYYNYMNILTSIAGSNGGSPFQSPPATVKGNIVNTANPDQFPLGYFGVSEVDIETYTVQ